MKSSKITSKYQETIPKDVRKQLKLQAGDSITFEVLDVDILYYIYKLEFKSLLKR